MVTSHRLPVYCLFQGFSFSCGKWKLVVGILISLTLLIIYRCPASVLWLSQRCGTNIPGPDPPSVVRCSNMKETTRPVLSSAVAGPRRNLQREIPLHVPSHEENIKVGESIDVYVMSAFQRKDYPVPNAFNLLLVTWADNQKDKHHFVCCLTESPSSKNVTQISAQKVYSDNRMPDVNLRYTLFGCSIRQNHTHKPSTSLKQTDFNYVAFAEKTCQNNMTLSAHEIVKNEQRQTVETTDVNKNAGPAKLHSENQTFAVCLKPTYGELSPQMIVEWMEYYRMLRVAVVQVYYHVINEAAMTVFRYYESTGFAHLRLINLPILKGHPARAFQRPRWERQAWMDGTVIFNDCIHRLHRHHYIAIIDLDELLLPLPPFASLSQVMQAAVQRYPNAGAFPVHSYIVVLDWPETDNVTSVSFLRHQDRSVSNKLDSDGIGKSSPKLIVRPGRVTAVASHAFAPRGKYTVGYIPEGTLTFLHYRSCKQARWNGCTFERTRDTDLQRFRSQWIQAINNVPLVELGCSEPYALGLASEAETSVGDNNTDH